MDLLFKDKSMGVSSQAGQTWEEISTVASVFRHLGGKEQVGVVVGVAWGGDWQKNSRVASVFEQLGR